MCFNIEIKRKYFNKIIEYGIIKGTNHILLIKSGQNGSINGYNNKYFEIAKKINTNYGYTVICSSNPYDGKHDPLVDALELIKEYVQGMQFIDYEIYYMGNSCGAMIGARWGYNYPEIKKMLLINAPLFTNSHLLLRGLDKFNGDKVILIYSEFDPSIKFVGLIDLVKNSNIKYYIIEGENHNFSMGKYDFKNLAEKYLIKDI